MKTVLLIEDEPMVVRSLRRLIGERAQIIVATTHEAARQMIESSIASEERFDLVLVDGELDDLKMSYDLIRTMVEHRLSDQIVGISGFFSRKQMEAGCTSAHPKGGDLNPFLMEFFEI